ncbi:MAG: hypothetical protein KDI79_27080 [Anaerolineae bacterium]|nr:hypothetical protein [Anaerolineae bacterium]
MAKSKRSRRDRRLQSDSSIQVPVSSAPKDAVPVQKAASPAAPAPAARAVTVDFAKDYYYVYAELRQIFIITAFMFAVMIGLSFVI